MAADRPEDADVRAWRRAYREGLPGERVGCPGAEPLAALASGQLEGDERLRVADHVSGCASCADDCRLLLEVHAEAERLVAAARRRRLALSLAAAAALVLAVGVDLRFGRVAGPGDGFRSRAADTGVAPAPGATLAAAPERLVWPAEAGAVRYRVQLYDARALVIWEDEPSPQTQRVLPQELRARLRPGAGYFWTVAVEGPAGRARLGPFWFRLAGP